MALVTLAEVRATLNLGDDASHDDELELYIEAVTAHVAANFRPYTAAIYTERLTPTFDGYGRARVLTSRYPVTAVTSAVDWDGTTTHTTAFTVSPTGNFISHDDFTAGPWDVTYTVGATPVPADLKIAVLEDIRGIYQPGQIGPAASFGAFGVDADTGPTSRPVGLWPRTDAWIQARTFSIA